MRKFGNIDIGGGRLVVTVVANPPVTTIKPSQSIYLRARYIGPTRENLQNKPKVLKEKVQQAKVFFK